MKQLINICISLCLLTFSTGISNAQNVLEITQVVSTATQQIGNQVNKIEASGKILNPRTVKGGAVHYVSNADWTSGFFPGTMWYMYELTTDSKWKDYGIKYTENLNSMQYLTKHHDIGFIINCSYGNAYRFTKNPVYKDVLIQAAQSLITRFRPAAGVIQSWDETDEWLKDRGWTCPVIIDNMMNLELLFKASRLSGDATFRDIAVKHAETTLKNHFRSDYSCYHVVDYDKTVGGVRSRETAQGYADESAWARGEAWALYGFTVCYRETKDPRYLQLTDSIYDFLFTHKNMPADLIPYWDFDAPNIPNEPRDASAAAIIASALYELSTCGKPEYKQTADKIVASLSSSAYLAATGTNGNFLLKHAVGSIPHHSEIDVPLNYADYYFLEAIARKKSLESNERWRSALYPKDWTPGFQDNEGRFFHDFSYAGYHSGLKDIPVITENIVDVTLPPYNADNTCKKDVTDVLQQAVDDLAKKGGGVLYLPAGEYLMSVSENKKTGLNITSARIVIRGAGHQKTFIKNGSTRMRTKSLIVFSGKDGSWDKPNGKEILLSKDVLLPTTIIPVENASSFKKGDYIVLKTDVTPEFKAEHKITGNLWDSVKNGVHVFRQIVSVNRINHTVEIDVPTRYFLKKRDNARIYKAQPQLSECGIEDLSIGNVEHPAPDGWTEDDWNIKGKGGYDVHASHLIQFRNVQNCWARNVHTYRPSENKQDIHVLSNCLRISDSRFVTIINCNLQKSLYEGAGGNGYMYTIEGNDCLFAHCHGENGRHNYDFKGMNASGNVLHNCYSKDTYLSSDFHMLLSMANLFDCFTADADFIDAGFRPWGNAGEIHMYSTTQSVIWNTKGVKAHKNGMLINSRQFGHGYVVGTSGIINNVVSTPISGVANKIAYDTTPEDWVEGEGKGETLEPQSLYLDQLEKRKKP